VIGNQSYLIRSGSLLWPSGFPFTGPEVEVVSAAVRLRVLVGLLVLGCSGPTIPPERWQLAGGRPLGELVTDSAPTAVLVIDPGEYSRCLGIVAPWLEWRRSGAGRFLLLLSRPPDATERRILIAAGIRFDETIVRGPPADSTPMELVFRGGRILYADAGLRGPSSVLLEKLRTMSLGEFAASVQTKTQTSPESQDHTRNHTRRRPSSESWSLPCP
jgi:hypothetical protein